MTVHILLEGLLRSSKPGLKRESESMHYSISLNEESSFCLAHLFTHCGFFVCLNACVKTKKSFKKKELIGHKLY